MGYWQTRSFWLSRRRYEPGPRLEGDQAADVVIVGAGFTSERLRMGHFEQDSLLVDPAALTWGLRHAAERRGVRIFEQTPVDDLAIDRGWACPVCGNINCFASVGFLGRSERLAYAVGYAATAWARRTWWAGS